MENIQKGGVWRTFSSHFVRKSGNGKKTQKTGFFGRSDLKSGKNWGRHNILLLKWPHPGFGNSPQGLTFPDSGNPVFGEIRGISRIWGGVFLGIWGFRGISGFRRDFGSENSENLLPFFRMFGVFGCFWAVLGTVFPPLGRSLGRFSL